MKPMAGKCAIVTGASAGIGRATALRFADQGAHVVVSDIDVEGGRKTVSLIRDCEGEATFVEADVSDEAAANGLVAEAVRIYGRLDYACNNAGIEGKVLPLAQQPIENFDAIIATNLRGTFLCMKAEIGEMLTSGHGAIVNVASVAGHIGFPGLSPYVASKHGVNGLTKNAALEYGKSGIRINSVCPGGVDTRMLDSLAEQSTGGTSTTEELMNPLHPIGRIGQPDEVASLIVWLCSDQASFVTGANVPVDGGFLAQ